MWRESCSDSRSNHANPVARRWHARMLYSAQSAERGGSAATTSQPGYGGLPHTGAPVSAGPTALRGGRSQGALAADNATAGRHGRLLSLACTTLILYRTGRVAGGNFTP